MTSALKESIIILKRISNQLNNVNNALAYTIDKKSQVYNTNFDKNEIYKIKTCMLSLISYSFVWYTSFTDEYYDYFKSTEVIEKQKILKIYAPQAEN